MVVTAYSFAFCVYPDISFAVFEQPGDLIAAQTVRVSRRVAEHAPFFHPWIVPVDSVVVAGHPEILFVILDDVADQFIVVTGDQHINHAAFRVDLISSSCGSDKHVPFRA